MKVPEPVIRATVPRPPTTSLFTQLGVALFEHVQDGVFKRVGRLPDWLKRLWPWVQGEATFCLQEDAHYLNDFLEEAQAHWRRGKADPLVSEPWTEVDAEGHEVVLQATAMRAEGRSWLLLSFPTTDFETFRRLLQEGREQNLQYHRLLKEINKREVLLHCIIHDLATPLAGIKGSLVLMEEDGLVLPEGERLLQIGLNQVAKMQQLIREILSVFASEVQYLLPTLVPEEGAPDVVTLAREVAVAMEAAAALKEVHLHIEADPDETWKVVAEPLRLERVLFNLIDNALRYAPPGSEVVIRVTKDGDMVRTEIEDRGPGVPEELAAVLFEKFMQGPVSKGMVGLGLYFCRLSVESWGGAIGYQACPEGGACFWFTLPRPRRGNVNSAS